MTRAPIMSILIIFEMTLDYATIMPLMLACVSAFYVARGSRPNRFTAASFTEPGEPRRRSFFCTCAT
jgi:CIC family chloride channel protein